MRTLSPILVVVGLFVVVLLAGAAIATPDSPTDDGPAINDSDSERDNTTAGICVTGVDSPCNGEQWDGDRPARTDETTDSGPTIGEGADLGICRIGVESPCNAEVWEDLPVDFSELPGGDAVVGTLRSLGL